ncbi:DUF2752 domain-containing protein [Adhaeribacter sp. BT258]|uniref:DUF2752 domain-containing protein n=1 Tax=Adhaeribacter terrigena TaxID=2793070 RepID=A0ABS1C8D9_9BACT|nr:DUF2752 domain-containing protein [Adhaeribacter terrigena]MBK0404943.1 DUF2752 domain-containing protein [Adhaeribacter terrigena]
MKKRTVKILKLSAQVIIPLVLLALPADFFDSGQSLCLSKVLAGIECYGCGMTRAIMHLIHLEFEAAYHFNKLSFVVFPVISFLWTQDFLKDLKLVRNDIQHQKAKVAA